MLIDTRLAALALVMAATSSAAAQTRTPLPIRGPGAFITPVTPSEPTVIRILDTLIAAGMRGSPLTQRRQAADMPARSYGFQSLAGPRAGVIYFSNGITKYSDGDTRQTSSNLMTIFGWQVENRSFELDNGLSGMTELVGTVAGIDQHLLLPAASLLMALRSPGGTEFGVGPTVSQTEINITFAFGTSIKASQDVRFPITVGFVPSRTGPRLSLMGGWVVAR